MMFNLIVLSCVLSVGTVIADSRKIDASCMQLTTTKQADDCCKTANVISKAIINKCGPELPVLKQTTISDEQAIKCIIECAARELGVLKNGVLDEDGMKKQYMKTMGADPQFGPVVEKAFDDCYKKLQAISPHEQQPDATGCGFGPYFLFNCVESNVFQNCPSPKWIEGTDCKELKDKLNSGCPFFTIIGTGE